MRLLPVEHDPFAGQKLAAVAPITEAQREIWLVCQMDPSATLAYNEASEITLRGPVDLTRLRECWQRIVIRHEALRATFSPNGDWMCIQAGFDFDVPLEDLSSFADERREQRLAQMRREEVTRRYDLEKGPLLSVRAVRISSDECKVFFTAHHIIVDGWSAAEIYKDFARLYDAPGDVSNAKLPLAGRFSDFARAEAVWRQTDEAAAIDAWWLAQFADSVPVFELPADRPRGATRDFAGGRVDHRLDAALITRLRKAGAAQGASLVATLLAGFAAQLGRIANTQDVVIGLSAAAQSYLGKTDLVGHAVNLLPLRIKPALHLSFQEHLKQTRNVVLDAFEHQRFTFGTLLPKLKIPRDPSRPPLVPVLFNIDVRNDPICPRGIDVQHTTIVREFENFELYLNLVDNGHDILIEASYNAELFTPETIQARLCEYDCLLRAVADSMDMPIAKLPLLEAASRKRIVSEWNDTTRNYPLHVPLHAFIEQQTARMPSAPAIVNDDGQNLDYAALDRKANQLAHELIARGVGADRLVAIYAQRGPEMVIALLATLKAGGAYLPLDPGYPAERLAFMLEDARPALVLVEVEGCEEMAPEAYRAVIDSRTPTFDLKRDWPTIISHPEQTPNVSVQPDQIAYAIYTSGSTGKPKGVLSTNRGIVNRLLWMQEEYRLRPADRVLQKTPYSFDVSVWEFFWPMMQGAALVLAKPEGHKDPAYLAELIQRENVTVCHFVPSMLAAFLEIPDAASCSSLRQVFCSGEALPYELTQRFFRALPDCQLHNLYGPTEASVDVSFWPCHKDDPRRIVPIGRPVANTQLYVLDSGGEPTPVGVPGELHIGGVQLARGYLERPQLTAERFIEHAEFGRLYRTGDLALWLVDGAVEYLGRLDFQVKLRGLRIELGEIEAELDAHPAVIESVVSVRERAPDTANPDARLVAWLALRNKATTASELRRHLRTRLPEHMVPQHFVELDALPQLANGKIDRKMLPSPFAKTAVAIQRTPPRSAVEKMVAAIWADLLGISDISVEDRFFDLGGHSLLAVRAATRIKAAYGVKLPLRAVMMDALGQIAEALSDEKQQRHTPGGDRKEILTGDSKPPVSSFGERRRVGREKSPTTALHFGDRRAPLLGMLTEPANGAARWAVVICPSWGTEYMRAYRGLHVFSQYLSAAGFAAFRFDYYGTGDSAGEGRDARLDRWIADIAAASREARDVSGASRVCLLGVRLGALLALNASAIARADALVLWDSPADGARYVEEMRNLDDVVNRRKNRYRSERALQPPPESDELRGHGWPIELARGIGALPGANFQVKQPKLLVYSSEKHVPVSGNEALHVTDAGHWSDVSRLDSPWIPAASFRQLTDHLVGWLP